MPNVDKDVPWGSSCGGRHPLRYAAAAVLAMPVGAIVWFELGYLVFGLTGEDPLYSLPLVAFALAIVLVILFGIGDKMATRRLERSQVQRRS